MHAEARTTTHAVDGPCFLGRRSIADGRSMYKTAPLVYYMHDKRLVANNKDMD